MKYIRFNYEVDIYIYFSESSSVYFILEYHFVFISLNDIGNLFDGLYWHSVKIFNLNF